MYPLSTATPDVSRDAIARQIARARRERNEVIADAIRGLARQLHLNLAHRSATPGRPAAC